MNQNLFDNDVPINGNGMPEVPFYATEHTVTGDVLNVRLSRHGFERNSILIELEKYRKETEHLRFFVQKTAQDVINAVDFEFDLSNGAISENVKTVAYRVVQEALNNIGKHSGADTVEIKLTVVHNLILLKDLWGKTVINHHILGDFL